MKRIFYSSLLLFLLTNVIHGQSNVYAIDKKIKVTRINFLKTTEAVFKKEKKQLVEIDFSRENDSVTYVTKVFNTDAEETKYHKVPTKIKTAVFDNIVDQLNQLNSDKIEYYFNIADGTSYSLSFGDSKYSINLDIHTTGSEESENEYGEFIKIFNSIWNQFEK